MENKENKITLDNRHIATKISSIVPLESLDLSKVNNFSDLAKGMSLTSFGGRQLGEAVDVLEAMIKDKDCLKVMTLSGAMTMAKMGLVICDMIENGMIDIIVSTGALMAHGFVESAGMIHYKNPGKFTDEELYKMGYDRVYDTLELEENLDDADAIFRNVLKNMDHNKIFSSHTINRELGRYLIENTKGRGILKSAFEHNIPVFVPAFSDSEFGLNFAMHNRERKMKNLKPLVFDPFIDLEKYTDMVFNAKKMGIFTIGGGVPRNWAQQVGPYLDALRFRFVDKEDPNKYFIKDKTNPYLKKFQYAVRICPEPAHWGGLSGCTYSEGVSWGKFLSKNQGGRYAEVICDATIAWPIIVKAVLERLDKNTIKL